MLGGTETLPEVWREQNSDTSKSAELTLTLDSMPPSAKPGDAMRIRLPPAVFEMPLPGTAKNMILRTQIPISKLSFESVAHPADGEQVAASIMDTKAVHGGQFLTTSTSAVGSAVHHGHVSLVIEALQPPALPALALRAFQAFYDVLTTCCLLLLALFALAAGLCYGAISLVAYPFRFPYRGALALIDACWREQRPRQQLSVGARAIRAVCHDVLPALLLICLAVVLLPIVGVGALVVVPALQFIILPAVSLLMAAGAKQAIMRFMFPGWAFSVLSDHLPPPVGTKMWDSNLRSRPRDKAGRMMHRHSQVARIELGASTNLIGQASVVPLTRVLAGGSLSAPPPAPHSGKASGSGSGSRTGGGSAGDVNTGSAIRGGEQDLNGGSGAQASANASYDSAEPRPSPEQPPVPEPRPSPEQPPVPEPAAPPQPEPAQPAPASRPQAEIIVVPALEDNYSYIILDRSQPPPYPIAFVDPADPEAIFAALDGAALPLTELQPVAIFTTHHHWDHGECCRDLDAISGLEIDPQRAVTPFPPDVAPPCDPAPWYRLFWFSRPILSFGSRSPAAGGNAAMLKHPGFEAMRVYGGADDNVQACTHWMADGDVVRVGPAVSIRAIGG